MSESEFEDVRLWSFPTGTIGHDDSVKGFDVEATDGHAGKVSWASYAPGNSYLVVCHPHDLHQVHHVVPAAAVERIDMPGHKLWLGLTQAEVEQSPQHQDPSSPLPQSTMDALPAIWATFAVRG